MQELNALLAENDVELSDDTLEVVSGGCSLSSSQYDQGDPTPAKCPLCGGTLFYWDMVKNEENGITRMYCNNPACSSSGGSSKSG